MVIYPSNTHNPVGNSNIYQSNETSLYPNQLFLFSTNYILDNFINNIIKVTSTLVTAILILL